MNQLKVQIEKATTSRFRLWLLNRLLHRVVPFNKPHGLQLLSSTANTLMVGLKHTRVNQNHIKGIHACALATLCEYVTGLSLLRCLDPKQYRIILKSIEITYHYQAKIDVTASYEMGEAQMAIEVLEPLKTTSALFKTCQVEVYDTAVNHICTGQIQWQIKAWKKVQSTA